MPTHRFSISVAILIPLAGCPADDSSSSTGGDTGTTGGPAGTDSTDTVTPSDSSGNATNGATGGSTGTPGDTTGTTAPGDSSGSTGAPIVCGDGTVDGDEACDDGNTDDGDGCSAACAVDAGWICDDASPTVCTTECGDRMVGAPVEECDDGNMDETDDCTNACLMATCGDGLVWAGNEACDDGNLVTGDGCSDLCEIEAGYACSGVPSMCQPVMYIADGTGGNAGNLYSVTLDGMTTTTIGPLSVGVTAMAFHPDGTLYAITSGGSGQLGTIDTATAMFTPIGPVQTGGGTPHGYIPDITFMQTQLVGWTENGDDMILIDTATAIATIVAAPEFSYGTGMAYDPVGDNLYVAPDGVSGPLWTITPAGMMSAGPTLGGTNSAVKALSHYGGLLYGLDTGFFGSPAGNVVTYDPATGATITLTVAPSNAVDALAVYDPDNTP